jgi:hypothetical protein
MNIEAETIAAWGFPCHALIKAKTPSFGQETIGKYSVLSPLQQLSHHAGGVIHHRHDARVIQPLRPDDAGKTSIIAPVLVEQALHDLPIIMHAFIAREITELDVIFKKINLNATSDKGEGHHDRFRSILA